MATPRSPLGAVGLWGANALAGEQRLGLASPAPHCCYCSLGSVCPRRPETASMRPVAQGRCYLSPMPSCPKPDWTCLHITQSPQRPAEASSPWKQSPSCVCE